MASATGSRPEIEGSESSVLIPDGIAPVPSAERTLSPFDIGVLWNDLSLGVLVLVTGGLLVPALGLPAALGAIVVGSVIGCVPLAAIARAGAREGLPGMVLFRPMLGRTGSYVPSLLNIAQLVGWTSVEFWAIGRLGQRAVDRGLRSRRVLALAHVDRDRMHGARDRWARCSS